MCVFIILIINIYAANAQDAMDYWNKSKVQIKEDKDYIGAIENLDKLLDMNATIPEAYNNRAIAKLFLGDFKGACSDFGLAKIFDNITRDRYRLNRKNPSYIDYYCNKEYSLELLHKYFYKGVKLDPEHDNRPYYTRRDTLRGALRPERTCYDVTYYDLNVRILPVSKRIKGKNDIYFTVLQSAKTIQIDLFEHYSIEKIEWNGQPLAYEREYDAVFIKFPEALPVGSKQMIRITYSGKPNKAPNPPWDCGFVWKRDKNHNRWVGVCCEQYGASSWWPNKDHLSDECDSMQISIETPGKLPVICNGVFRKSVLLEDGYTRHTWFVSYPINNYDVTFYWGDYRFIGDTVVFLGDTLKGHYYVLPQNYERAKKYLKQTDEVVSFYCNAFGKYPF
jgi:tetratricopeptide (TPR) repeat protein